MQSPASNSALNPVVHGYIALSINTQYNFKLCHNTYLTPKKKEKNISFIKNKLPYILGFLAEYIYRDILMQSHLCHMGNGLKPVWGVNSLTGQAVPLVTYSVAKWQANLASNRTESMWTKIIYVWIHFYFSPLVEQIYTRAQHCVPF